MADGNESNFGNADGGGTVDVTDDGANAGSHELPGGTGATDPANFKRGRGRPRKDAGTGEPNGTKQQAGKSTSQKSARLDVDLFAKQIVGAHQMLAMVTKNQIWLIDDGAAKNLATALRDVMSHHQININPATLAYVKLLAVCAAIYGPKLMLVNMQAKQKRNEAARTVDV